MQTESGSIAEFKPCTPFIFRSPTIEGTIMGDTFRTILVAIAVKGSDERDRQTRIVSALNGIEDRVPGIDSWWIADDLRYHMQDGAYDSAIFVPYGSQMIARKLISQTREEAHGQEGQTSD